MALDYGWGLFCVYLGFLLTLWECIKEELLIRGRYVLQVGCVLVTLAGAGWFTLETVIVYAPLTFDCYALYKTSYAAGTTVAGIPWDSHFTDLRVYVSNPSESDYSDIDILIAPDRWNYKASILGADVGCSLIPKEKSNTILLAISRGGARELFGHDENGVPQINDDAGDIFEPFIMAGGYRLRCPRFPASFTLQIVFALVSPSSELLSGTPMSPPQNAKPGAPKIFAAESPPGNKFDLLNARPMSSSVAITGHYRSGLKVYRASQKIEARSGD